MASTSANTSTGGLGIGVRSPVRLAAVPHKEIGVAAALRAADDADFEVKPAIFDEFKLTNKVGVVTGGNGGLGLEMCVTLAELGAKVYAIDIHASPSSDFKAASAFATRLGTSLQYRTANVTNQGEIGQVIEQIADENDGKIDVVIAAAGVLGREHNVEEYPAEEFKAVIDVNCNGVFYTTQAAARQMKQARSGGSIILIASMSGTVTNRDMKWAPYNTSKAAVIQMARSMACELGPDRIRVNSLSPGHIRTKMTAAVLDKQPETEAFWASLNPLGRIGAVHELRGVIAWLASDASSFCTGSDIIVSGGHTIW
ncbi:hypothetical protein V1514DRAFT_337900 [Lipomyces japonicus]|uniref:uncharacterized protein n=1 Tax=Lipomyces japonicus TaxID=56871 RepID=UPI0034CDAE8A